MASLLDLMIMRQNPMGAGLLGIGGPDPQDGKSQAQSLVSAASQVRAPSFGGGVSGGAAVPDPSTSVPEEGTGSGSFLQRLFAGGNAEGLSPEQNAEIRRRAMLISGLHTLANVGEKGLKAVPEGIIAGQGVAAEAREDLLEQAEEQARRERLASIAEGMGGEMTREGISQGIRASIAAGDSETAKLLTDVLDEYPETEEGEPDMKLVNVQGVGSFLMDSEGRMRDPFTQELVTEMPELAPDAELDHTVENIYDPESGQMMRIRFSYDPTGALVRRTPLGISEAPEEVGQGDLSGMATGMEANLATLEQLIEEHGVPNEVQERLLNRLKPAWVQQYESAAGNIDILASRLMFGARVSDSEREALSEVLTPRAGDEPAVIEQKIENLRRTIEDFKKQQGIFAPDREEGSGGLSRYGLSDDDPLNELGRLGS